MKRKVLVVLPELETGGGQRMAISIIHHIMDPQIQARILVFYPRKGEILEKVADEYGLDVQYLHKKAGIDLHIIKEIDKAIQDYQPDVIHAHLRVMPYLLLPLIRSKVPLRYYTVHNLADKDANGIKRLILRFAFRNCNVHPIAISDFCRKSIFETYKISEDKIPCIYVGIDTVRFARPYEYKMMTSTPFRFSSVGRLMKQKNYFLMLQAFKQIHERYPDTRLVIIGDGELKEELMQFCRIHQIENVVRFTGNISNVEEYLWISHAYIISSDYEGLPQSVLEAMAAGLPIISTKAGGIVDVVENEKNGLLVDCGDLNGLIKAMENLVNSPELCQKLSENSIIMAQKYSIQNCADRYRELYLAKINTSNE